MPFTRSIVYGLIASAAVLAACSPQPSPEAPAGLSLFGAGYPEDGDRCRRARESAVTSPYLDHTADLVACPPGAAAGLEGRLGARRVAEHGGWVLFSVPRP